MRALTLHQPWAELIITIQGKTTTSQPGRTTRTDGPKTVEERRQCTH